MNDQSRQSWLHLIEEREQLLGQPSVRQMAQIFIDEIGEQIKAVQASLKVQDFVATRRVAHQIAGNSGALDFTELCNLAQTLERNCRDRPDQISPAILAELTEHARSAETLLKGHYSL